MHIDYSPNQNKLISVIQKVLFFFSSQIEKENL